MKINCELPNCMIDYNNELNEYDFVLFHLYKSNPIYRKFYKNQRLIHPERLMIFDNSAYEFYIKGEILDIREFVDAIDDLKPDYYILPDKLMDKQYTLYETRELLKFNKPLNTKSKPMGVLQGIDSKEMIDCLNEYKTLNINAIAIPFHNSFYKQCKVSINNEWKDIYKNITEDHIYAWGRVQFIIENKEHLNQFKHIHILGSHCPLEVIYYDNFQTMDTGYPVKCGIEGYKLFEEPKKPNIIIDDFMDIELEKSTINLIKNNVNCFRELT